MAFNRLDAHFLLDGILHVGRELVNGGLWALFTWLSGAERLLMVNFIDLFLGCWWSLDIISDVINSLWLIEHTIMQFLCLL